MLTGFAGLSTPLVADACIRRKVPLRVAPPGIGAVIPGRQIAGRALPARHYGSVDVFLEAFSSAGYGDVLVVDNGGRADEACVGDLVVLEAQAAGLGGVVVWVSIHAARPYRNLARQSSRDGSERGLYRLMGQSARIWTTT